MVNPQTTTGRFSNVFGKAKDLLLGAEYVDSEDETSPVSSHESATAPSPRANQQIRLQSGKANKVTIRSNVMKIEDVVPIADGLKNGEYQIVNTERATVKDAEKIVDFLNGVIYALNGQVKHAGEKVYLYVPANVTVDTDENSLRSTRRPITH